MKIFSRILIISAVAAIFALAGAARAATTIYSPPNYSTYNTGTTVGFYWNNTSPYNYVNIYTNGAWGAWIDRGNQTDYTGVTQNAEGWLGAQAATWENNQWEYSNIVWVWFQNPPPPPPPPPVPGGPTLNRAPNDPVYKGDAVTFSWDNPANTTDFYIIYRRDGAWDGSWSWLGLAQSQNFTATISLSDLSVQVAACNVSGCGYSNQPVIALLNKTPEQMNLTPLSAGNGYSDTLSGGSDVKYAKISNNTGSDQVYSVKITANTANAAVALVDGAGNASPADSITLNSSYIVFKVITGQTRYTKFTGTQSGGYSYTFNRFRNFPYFEGP